MTTIDIAPREPEHLTFTVTATDERGNVSRTWIDLPELLTALDRMADTLGGYTAEAGVHFTCSEAETVAAVLRAGGRSDAAEDWISGHADGDDEGDDHWTGDNEDEDGAA